jgi:hypothetical protein
MSIFRPLNITSKLQHELEIWGREEAYRHYAEVRRRSCEPHQLLDLWMRAPVCSHCVSRYPLRAHDAADIRGGRGWEEDVEWKLGEDTLLGIKRSRIDHDGFALRCKVRGCSLMPWDGDEVFIESYHLEEHFSIPMETGGRISAGRKLRSQIFKVYGGVCFACGVTEDLHIDHIRPRALGGDAAFRNLQPLCRRCGQNKGSREAEERSVFDDMYFLDYPSDGYEGLFW